MSETLPRWGLPEVDFVETDSATIQSEMLSAYQSITGRTLESGDPVRLLLLTIAYVIVQLRSLVNIAAQQNLLSYAQGEYLDALGTYVGVTRLEASSAVTTIQFTLSRALANAYTIPAGFEVTNGIVTFATNIELTIAAGSTTGEVSATCTEPGEAGNDYAAGEINTIVVPKTYLASAENITVTSGGADAELDEDLAERIRLAPNAFSVAGPTKAYIYHAKSASSAVSDVSVVTPSAGYVNVYILLEGGVIPTDDVLEEVYNYLSADDIRPLTDYVQVLAPDTHNYVINVDYWINEDDSGSAEAIQMAVEDAAKKYMEWQQEAIGRDISPEKLLAMLVDAGAARVDSSTLSPAEFVELGAGTVAQCQGLTVTYQGVKED